MEVIVHLLLNPWGHFKEYYNILEMKVANPILTIVWFECCKGIANIFNVIQSLHCVRKVKPFLTPTPQDKKSYWLRSGAGWQQDWPPNPTKGFMKEMDSCKEWRSPDISSTLCNCMKWGRWWDRFTLEKSQFTKKIVLNPS